MHACVRVAPGYGSSCVATSGATFYTQYHQGMRSRGPLHRPLVQKLALKRLAAAILASVDGCVVVARSLN